MQPEDEQRGQARVHRQWKGRIVQEQDYIKEGRGKLSGRQREQMVVTEQLSHGHKYTHHSLHDCVCLHITFYLFVSKQQSNSPFLCGHFGFVHFYHINISCRLQEKEKKTSLTKKETSINIQYNDQKGTQSTFDPCAKSELTELPLLWSQALVSPVTMPKPEGNKSKLLIAVNVFI